MPKKRRMLTRTKGRTCFLKIEKVGLGFYFDYFRHGLPTCPRGGYVVPRELRSGTVSELSIMGCTPLAVRPKYTRLSGCDLGTRIKGSGRDLAGY